MNKIITLALCLIGFTAFGQIPTTGLVSYYPFTHNADDQSGNHHNGTVNGATLTEDRFLHTDRAYDFNGISDYISIPHNLAIKPNFPFSISLWFKIDAFGPTSSTLYASDEVPGIYSGFWVGYLPAGTISAGYGDGQGIGSVHRVTKSSTTIVDTSAWHNVIAVFNGPGDIDLYIDCQLDPGSYSGTGGSMQQGTSHSTIGRSLGHLVTSYHNGKIDDIRLYNVALDAEGINDLCTEDPYISIDEASSPDINVYPNPTSEAIYIEMPVSTEQSSKVEIHDVCGRTVYSNHHIASTIAIPLSDLTSSGFYFVSIFDADDKLVGRKKIILR